MRRRHFAILALLTAGICLTGLLVLIRDQPGPVADVSLLPRGIQTNSAGTLCMLVAVTNKSSWTCRLAFAIETKPADGWADPASVKQNFGACSGETLPPGSGTEVLVPVPQTGVSWRVTAAYFDQQEKIPGGWLGRRWRSVRMRLNPGHYLKFATTPEISSNKPDAANPAMASQLQAERRGRKAADPGR